MIYTKTQTVYTSRAGANTCLSLIGAVEIVQDSICEFFKSIGIDEITLKTKHNCIWVFTRNSVEFLHSLSWDESFNIECFISSISPAKLVVDTAFYKLDGTLSLKSETEICLVDLSTFKLKRIDDNFVSQDKVSPKKFDISFSRILTDDNMTKVSTIMVPSTSIDYCGHVNNAEYLRFILNTYFSQELNRGIKRLDITYLSQALEGDKLSIYKAHIDKSDIFEIKSFDKSLTKCRITFE